MKNKVTYLFAAFIAVVIFGCNKTTSTVTAVKPQITGKWYMRRSNDAYYVYTTLAHTDSVNSYTNGDYMQLNLDGTGFISGSYAGLPSQNIKYMYAAKDSVVVLYQYLNTDSATTDSVSLKTLLSSSMSWSITQKQTTTDSQETEVYNFYFGR